MHLHTVHEFASRCCSCDSSEYLATTNAAYVMIGLWPVGCPLLYATLLAMSRDALMSGVPTTLSQATAFLSSDYEAAAFWWEPLETCRRCVLTGALTRTYVC